MESTQPDFTGQHVFTGLDVALRAWKVCVLVGESYHRRFSMEPDPEALVRLCLFKTPSADRIVNAWQNRYSCSA
jgi:hypothetical protein